MLCVQCLRFSFCSTKSSNMPASLSTPSNWQLDRVRASCLTTRPCATSDARFCLLRVYRWSYQKCGYSRSQKFTACMFARDDSYSLPGLTRKSLSSSRVDTKRCPWCHIGNTAICVSCRTRQVETTTREPRATKSRWFRSVSPT